MIWGWLSSFFSTFATTPLAEPEKILIYLCLTPFFLGCFIRSVLMQRLVPSGFCIQVIRFLPMDFRLSIFPLIKASFFLRVHRLI